jgi:hypothetical protein
MALIAVGLGLGALGSVLGANSAKSSAAKAADANLRNTADTNAANYKLFQESRGAIGPDGFGHSILPNYFGGNEQDMAKQAYDNFNRLNQGVGATQGYLQGYQNALRPAITSSLGAIANRFNGQDLAQRLGYAQPVFDARLAQAGVYGRGARNTAAAQSGSINTALLEALGQLNAQRSAQGFVGGGTFDRNRMLASLTGARGQAAVGTAQADALANNSQQAALYQNAVDRQGYQLSDLENMSNTGYLSGALQNLGNFESYPAMQAAALYQNAQSPLNYFRIAPQTFQNAPAPQQTPQIGSGQVWGAGLGALGSALSSYGMYQGLTARAADVTPYTGATYNWTGNGFGGSGLSPAPGSFGGK